jgi:WD40 repeat protein
MTARSARADTPRKYLLTGVVSHYLHDPSLDRPGLAEDERRIVEFFADFGYEHVPIIGGDPTRERLRTALRRFCLHRDRKPEDYIVVYLAGHGEILPYGPKEHALLMADLDPDDLRTGSVKAAELADWMLAGTRVHRLLLIVDACMSGQAALDFVSDGSRYEADQTGLDPVGKGYGIMALTVTQPNQMALQGEFTKALIRSRNRIAKNPAAFAMIRIEDVVDGFSDDPQVLRSQRPELGTIRGRGSMPSFLVGEDPVASVAGADWTKQREKRAADMSGWFVRGIDAFIGREAARRRIVDWLEDSSDTKAQVVIGDPGSGKSALLGRFAVVSDSRYEDIAPVDRHADPQVGAIDVAIYAGGRAGSDILAGIAVAAEVPGIETGTPLSVAVTALLLGLAVRGRPLVVLLDAIDEANDPREVIEDVLCPLMGDGAGRIRLLVGGRRQICHYLVQVSASFRTIDLDSPAYADPDSLSELVLRQLVACERRQSSWPPASVPAASPRRQVVRDMVTAIAKVAGNSYLLAVLLAELQASRGELPNPHDPEWLASLPQEAGEVMYKDFSTRLGDQAGRALSLLLPLAYAQGAGLPWGEVWPAVANALTPGSRSQTGDLLWLHANASSYIADVEQSGGRRLLRLCHPALADFLRKERDEAADEDAIVTALLGRIHRTSDGNIDWSEAHPYVHAYLSVHAVRSGRIDELAQYPGFLLNSEPSRLLSALGKTTSPPARAAAAAYRRALPSLRNHPVEEHSAYLSLAARCARADHLADNILVENPWRARWASWQLQRPHIRIPAHIGAANAAVVASVDQRQVVVSGGDDGTLRVWDTQTGASVRRPAAGHDDAVTALALSALEHRRVVVSGSADRTVRVCDLVTSELVGMPFTGHTRRVRAVATALLNGEEVVVSSGDDGTVRISSLASGAAVGEAFRRHHAPVAAVACGELDGAPVVVSGDEDGLVLIWMLDTDELIACLRHSRMVRVAAVGELEGRPIVITGCEDTQVRVWDMATGERISETSRVHTHGVWAVAPAEFAGIPVVVSGSSNGTIRVSSLATGEPVGDSLAGHNGPVRALTVASVDGRPSLVSGGSDGSVRVWDVGEGVSDADSFVGHKMAVNAIALSELDGHPVAISGGKDATARVWDLATGSQIREPFADHVGAVTAVMSAFITGRPAAVTGGADGSVRVWDLATCEAIGEPYVGHSQRVTALAHTSLADTTVVLSGAADASVHVWNLATRATLGRPFTGHTSTVHALGAARLGDRTVVISGDENGSVHVWDLATRAPVGHPFTRHTGRVLALTVVDEEHRTVVISSGDDGVRIWDLESRVESGPSYTAHGQAVRAVATAELGQRRVVVSGGADNTARIWDLKSRAAIGPGLLQHQDGVHSLAIGGLEGRPVAISGSGDAAIHVWEIDTGTDRFARHSHWVRAVAVTKLGKIPVVLSGSVDATIRVWALKSGKSLGRPITGHTQGIRAVVTTRPAGSSPIVVSGGDDRTVRVWDLTTGAPIGRPLTGHSDWVRSLAVADVKGSRVVISGGDSTVRVWRLPDGEPIGSPYTGHSSWVRVVAVAHLKGQAVVLSAGADTTVQVWDPATGENVGKPYTEHRYPVRALTVTELGGRPVVISASDNASVHVWDLETRRPIGAPYANAAREISALAVEQVTGRGAAVSRQSIRVVLAAGEKVTVLRLTTDGLWTSNTSADIRSDVLTGAWSAGGPLVLGSKLGIIAIDVSG